MWRVGRHQRRNIYNGDTFIAVVIGSEDTAGMIAARICDALNEQDVDAEKNPGGTRRGFPESHLER